MEKKWRKESTMIRGSNRKGEKRNGGNNGK